MLIISYDISDDKLRTKFSKYLEKYGRRLQYSVFELRNSTRIINNILTEIEKRFEPRFKDTDSIIIIPITPADRKKVIKYGSARYDEQDVVVFTGV